MGLNQCVEVLCVPQENGEIFEALKTMSAYFLRADAHAICQCIQAFGLNDLLFSIVRLERLFARSRETSPVRRELTNTGQAELQGLSPLNMPVIALLSVPRKAVAD